MTALIKQIENINDTTDATDTRPCPAINAAQ